ncbi:Class I peroxidase protein [Dioscorea alata]|uniref:Class I peroxidase protein n=1 Tax=Dioscorea alata TaxID=55571 RepID=A0ACB7WB24_DIOAL|nr:Class I peroxidase protein [Dioscorea alata]
MLNKMTSFKQMVLVFMLIELYTSYGALALSMDYYRMSCPFAEMIVRMTVNQALRRDQTLAGPLLRLHFHDCFVQGCDASVLIDSTEGNIAEKDSPANIILRGYEVIDQAKQIIENRCPGVVSCADIVAISARDAVVWAGGPFYPVLQGRRDGSRSKIEDTINLPPPNFNSTALISMFGRHGFTIQDLVALSGGHTIGVARCASFKDRLSNSDSTMNTNLVRMASMQCNAGDDNTTMNLDMTSTSFDNSYFRALQRGYGLLTSDETLFMDDQTRGFVDIYAMNQARWFYDFQSAMLKMGSIDVKEGDDGNVRLNCHRLNY